MLDQDQAKAITDRVIRLSKADQVTVQLSGGTSSNLRFARNTPSTSGSSDDAELTIASSFGTRTGSVSVNQFDEQTLASAVRRSEEMARMAPEDPEHMPALGPQSYRATDAFSKDTAERGSMAMAEGVALAIAQAREQGMVAAGFAETSAGYSCLANSNGLFGYHRATSAYLSQTARTHDNKGSGWASASSHRIADIDAGRVSRSAIDKARMSAGAKPLAPGDYVTILEPACVANILGTLMFSMDARRADEGRSFFSKPGGGTRVGEALFPETVNIYSDPSDPGAPAAPWGEDGLPQERRMWVDRGVLGSLMTSRYWAQKTGQAPVPRPGNLIMRGGEGSVADLIATTERGVLVTSLWYIRPVDPRTLLFTGLTRDGVFWIEDGKIAHPVQNFRWNDSPISIFGNIEAMSRAERIPPRGSRANNIVVPGLRVKKFHFSSVSDAV